MSIALDLQGKIRAAIPLSDAMQFNIVELKENSILVHAPLSPNVNIHGTGFAGSIYSLAVLTGWAMVTHIIKSQGFDGDLVVGKAEIRYRKPVGGDIECRCSVPDNLYQAFNRDMKTNGKAKLSLEIEVGDSQALLNATFFASVESRA